jgi:O-methyltransferase involved in polyketide biosynthesis
MVECSQFGQAFNRTTSLRSRETKSNAWKVAEMIKVQANVLWKMRQNRESEHDLRRLGNRIDANEKTPKKKRATPRKSVPTIERR